MAISEFPDTFEQGWIHYAVISPLSSISTFKFNMEISLPNHFDVRCSFLTSHFVPYITHRAYFIAVILIEVKYTTDYSTIQEMPVFYV